MSRTTNNQNIKIESRTFVWHFDCPVEDIWPIMADTARFNEAAGLPKHDIAEIAQPDGSVEYIAQAKMGPFDLVWEDHPVNWVENKWFRHARTFRTGPLSTMCATLEFFPEEAGCRGVFILEASAANLLGRLILATRFFSGTERTFTLLVNHARDFVNGRLTQNLVWRRLPCQLAPQLAPRNLSKRLNRHPTDTASPKC